MISLLDMIPKRPSVCVPDVEDSAVLEVTPDDTDHLNEESACSSIKMGHIALK